MSPTRGKERDQRGQRGQHGAQGQAGARLGDDGSGIDLQLRLGEAPPDVDRGDDTNQAGLLGVALQGQVQRLAAQIDAALAGRHHHACVQDQAAGCQDAVPDIEVGDGAAQVRLLGILGQQLEQARDHVDAHQLGEGLTHLAGRNGHRDGPVGRGGGLVHGVA